MKRTPTAPVAPAITMAQTTGIKEKSRRQQARQRTALKAQLQERLQRLSFSAFESLMQQALARSGFTRISAPSRPHSRGRHAHGGLDLSAYSTTDLTDSLTIVQIKQYQQSVPRRFIDELRGAMLRTGARHGLLLTTSHFSRAASVAAGATATGATATGADSLAPIRLISGRELCALLIQHNLGIRQQSNGRQALDKRFFRHLEASALAQHQTISKAARPAFSKPLPPTSTQSQTPIQSQTPTQSSNPVALPRPSETADQKGHPMTWSTHVLFGISSLWLLQAIPTTPLLPAPASANFALVLGAAALGALLPDLDAADSKLKHLTIGGVKPFFLPAQFVHRQLGHRGFAHSLCGLFIVLLVALPLMAWWGWATSLALVLGYASHLLADACTKSGIPVFYPNKYRYHLLPPGWRFTTGSQAEALLFPFLASAVLLLLLSHLYALITMPL